ncbi:MAG: hypothetical protein JWR50_1899 [Mucilaginibacter sp.]|nr:hypothetical protein [Mucilaginibacter sp.]
MKHKVRHFLTTILLLNIALYSTAQQSCPKWGPYVKTVGIGKYSDELMMADVMIPTDGLAPYTYACSVQFGIGKSGGYCGIQLAGPNEPRIPNPIFSLWDFPNKLQISAAYKNPLTFVGGFGGEGTGLHSHADFGWKPGQWYTNIVRRWSVNDSTTQVGYWVYDHTAKMYTHFVTFTVPEKGAMLHGDIGSFLENFADNEKRSRTAVYKSYWMLTDQYKWVHPDSLVAEAGEGSWKAERYGDDGVKATSCGTSPWQKKTFYAVTQKDKPDLIAADIYDLAAYYDHSQKKIFVDWSLLETASPQLSYDVQIFDNSSYTGNAIASLKGTDPDLTGVGITVKGLNLKSQNYYISLQIKDIFGQLSPLKKFVLAELKP